MDSGGPKEAQGQSYLPGGANVPTWEGILVAPPGKYDWTVCLRQRCGFMSNYFDHLLIVVIWVLVFVFSVSVRGFCRMSFSAVYTNASCDCKDRSNGSESQPSFIWFLCASAWSFFLPLQGQLLISLHYNIHCLYVITVAVFACELCMCRVWHKCSCNKNCKQQKLQFLRIT